MSRNHWLPALIVVSSLAACAPSAPPAAAPFSVVEATIPEMRQAMEQGRATSRQLVERYLQRIALHEDKLNATITVNPRALDEADRLDAERKAGQIRGPLHGIPVALKDNIHTTDIRTTGGSIAFENLMPPYDATLTKNLRDAGAIILAKTVMTELANFIASGIQPLQNLAIGQKVGSKFGEEAKKQWLIEVIEEGMTGLEHMLVKYAGTHCFGDSFTLADACLIPQAYAARRFGVDLAKYPTISKVLAHIEQLDISKATHPDQMPDAVKA